VLEFEASSSARIGAWGLLGFWALFGGFWLYECLAGDGGRAAWAWAFVAAAGLGLQAIRVRAIQQPLLLLGAGRLEAQGLLGRYATYELGRAQSASVLQRRTRATLYVHFEAAGALGSVRGRWLYPIDELAEPRAFVTELLERIPQAQVDVSVRRYLRGEELEPRSSFDRHDPYRSGGREP
jgi:hypothetical protein